MNKLVSAVVASCAVAVNLSAQEQSAATNRMPDLVVTAVRLPGQDQPLAKTPANVSIIDRQQIRQSSEVDVPDLLAHQVGLQNIDNGGGFGNFSTPNMRGFGENSGTLVLVDGVRVNDPANRSMNAFWPSIAPQDIERLEIIRGGGSTVYGEGALGGVINIITRRDIRAPYAEADVTFGNMGYVRSHLESGTPVGPARVSGSATYESADGARDFSAFYKKTVRGSAGVTTDAGDFDATVYYHKDRLRNPGPLTSEQYAANPDQIGDSTYLYENETMRVMLDWRKAFDSGFTAQAKTYIQSFDQGIAASGKYANTVDITEPTWGTTVQLSHAIDVLGGQNMATIGGEFIRQNYSQEIISAFGDTRSFVDYDTTSAFFQDSVDVTEKLRLQAGARFDARHYDLEVPFFDMTNFTSKNVPGSRDVDAWSPSGGAVYALTKTENVYFNISRSFSLPLANDISTVSSEFNPSPDIQPIEATNYEVGFRWNRWKEFSGSIAFYHSDLVDDILFDPFTLSSHNFDETRNGIELALESRPLDWLQLYFNYTLQDSRFEGGEFDGNQIPQVPQHMLKGGVAWVPVKWFRWSWEVNHIRDQVPTNDFNNRFERNEYTLVNTRLSWTPWKWGQVYLAVNNVLDGRFQTFPTASYSLPQVQQYNPVPGAMVLGGVSVKF